MKIITLNTWGGQLKEEITTFTRQQAQYVDVFCFQETYKQIRTIAQEILSEYTEVYAEKYITDDDQFLQSIFVRNEYPIVDSGTIFAEDFSVGLGLWATIQSPQGPLLICNYHGMSRPVDKLDTPERLSVSKTLSDFVLQKQLPSVILGDFNLLETTQSIKYFKESGFRDLIQENNITNTRNRYVWERFPDTIQYHASFVFTTAEIKNPKLTVLPDLVSDHMPLLLEF